MDKKVISITLWGNGAEKGKARKEKEILARIRDGEPAGGTFPPATQIR